MRRAATGVVASLLACLGTLGVASVARAECPFFVIPPATDAARSAREVVVGTVIENVGDQLYDFRLRIDRVLRGPAHVGDVRRMNFVYPGWPLIEANNEDPGGPDDREGKMVGPCEPIPGWEGNVIALSLDALAPDGLTRYNAASWISGDLPINRDLPRTTLPEMVRLSGMPQTDVAAVRAPVESRGPSLVGALLVCAFAMLAVTALRGNRRAR
jgi:hypothetical protein